MAQQKLYTEEQVREMLSKTDIIVNGDFISHNDIIAFTTPIELPSDEEIEEQANIHGYEEHPSFTAATSNQKRLSWIAACKWYREQLKTK